MSDGDERDDRPMAEFTRYKFKMQFGDGPDNRGEVTVELVREVDHDSRDARERPDPSDPDHSVKFAANDSEFAEAYFEMDRAARALREQLGLPDPEDEEGE